MTDFCNEIEKFGKGIGNTARYHILEALFSGEKTVTQLVKVARLSQPAVSQHLKTLKACNLVVDQRKGQEVYYSVNAEYTMSLLKHLVQGLKKPAIK